MESAENLKNEDYMKKYVECINIWILEKKHVHIIISQRDAFYNIEFLDQDLGIIRRDITSLMIKYISKKEVDYIMEILREKNFVPICRTDNITYIPYLQVSKSGEVYFSGITELKRGGHLSKISQIIFHERNSVSVGKICRMTTKKVTFNEEGYLKFLSYLEAHNAYDIILILS
jgi:hypothetical protein